MVYKFNGNDFSDSDKKIISYETGIIWLSFTDKWSRNIYRHRWWLEKIQTQILCAAASAQYWIETTLKNNSFHLVRKSNRLNNCAKVSQNNLVIQMFKKI
jgi:hypothetical protein